MRLAPHRLSAFLVDPGRCRVALFHGEDAGLVRSRSAALIRSVTGDADDPFRVLELHRASIASLGAEARAVPLTGGRRVLRVRDAGDWTAEAVKSLLAGPAEALVVLESNSLPPRSKLRATIEEAELGASITCFPPHGAQLEAALVSLLAQHDTAIDADALRWVCSQTAPDFGQVERSADTLALYAGPERRVDLAAAMSCVGDSAALSLDNALLAMSAGKFAEFDRALVLALQDGQTAVAALRSGSVLLQRLQRARWTANAGNPAAAPGSGSHWRQAGPGDGHSTLSDQELEQFAQSLASTELACKQTGAPAETICRNALVQIAQAARTGSRR